MAFLPIAASNEITKKYNRYLNTIFKFKDIEYNKQFKQALCEHAKLAKGPYLDVADSFLKGKTIEELISEGLIPENFRRLGFNLTRPLYKHQQEAIEKAFKKNNMVVSTGTGSGKTESFLIPLFTEIVREYEEGCLDAGVRALLIYPMNALANDQIERLRTILKNFPEITYGCYTGQTKDKYRDAIEEYKELNEGNLPDENELISREQMKKSPPHILITNYAMLEYLMIRPDDSVFFEEGLSDKWKYIVLDEAHVYSGSTGIEVSMLLRRLKATLRNNKIRYILTSATLGDEKSNKQVATFAENLCSANFDQDNVIRATRVTVLNDEVRTELDAHCYCSLADELSKTRPEKNLIIEVLENNGVKVNRNQEIEACLYDALLYDRTFKKLKQLLDVPKTVEDISNKMGWKLEETEKFVIVASKAVKNGINLFDARYHMFLRAAESAFVTLAPNKKVFLDRKKFHYENNKTYKVFEVGVCSSCHTLFLIGEIQYVEKKHVLEQSTQKTLSGNADVFIFDSEYGNTNEDFIFIDDDNIDEYELCPYCGFIRKTNVLGQKETCEHGETELVKILKIKNKLKEIKKCPACESVNNYGIVRMFFTGQEAVTSVIGTALFEELPSYEISINTSRNDDCYGFGFTDSDTEESINKAKQFIAFSDSRQAAAYYASYMDKSYRNILYKRMIVDVLRKNKDVQGMHMSNIVSCLTSEFEKYDVCNKGDYVKKEAWKAILNELIDNSGNTSLTEMGLIGIGINNKVKIPPNNKLGLSEKDVKSICEEFILSMLTNAAVNQEEVPMTKEDDIDYTHGGVLTSFTLSDTDSKRLRKAFIPTKVGLSNKRIDYITKILNKYENEVDSQICKKVLEAIWNHILIKKENGLLINKDGAYRVNADCLTLYSESDLYICPVCKKITRHNVRGVCPTYKCSGELTKLNPEEYFKDNHYYDIYQNLEIRPLRIVEHTAQLSREKSYEYQKQFKNKEIDVLSCSTTFEMGVDVGSLETVFMRNMPPSPSNYAQRAGRAGRSITSAAYALTFCNKSNHDFAFFNNPVGMIKGKILPPAFNINNDKIAIRHVYAVAMSFFWKKYPEYFSVTQKMMERETEANKPGIEIFVDYLKEKPSDLKEYLKAFLPKELAAVFEIEKYGWLDGFIKETGEKKGILIKAGEEYSSEVEVLMEERKKLNENMKGDGYILQRIKTYQNEPVIAFFSRKGILPRYGFPVDTVELSMPINSDNKSAFGLQLQRDLSMAISEYAPGSQIVANGNLITSRYIKKRANMLWKMYDYKMCECGSILMKPHTEETEQEWEMVCQSCGKELPETIRTFIIPETGFVADLKGLTKPGLIKPVRTYNNETAYLGTGQGEFIEFSIGDSKIEIRHNKKDEMLVVNQSNFFVCHDCGYTEIDNANFHNIMLKEHRRSTGNRCSEKRLRRYGLGYKFETNVTQIRFNAPTLPAISTQYYEMAYSVLQGFLNGFRRYYSIDERDVSGCLHYYTNELTGDGAYEIILYDKTPGGSGYANMLNGRDGIEAVLKTTRHIMLSCSCGGEKGNSSCYSCLRNYYNQKNHDIMKRRYVIDFIDKILEKNR